MATAHGDVPSDLIGWTTVHIDAAWNCQGTKAGIPIEYTTLHSHIVNTHVIIDQCACILSDGTLTKNCFNWVQLCASNTSCLDASKAMWEKSASPMIPER